MENWFNIIGWLFSIATVAGNGFVIFLIATNQRLHSQANWFVLSLAVADFGVGIAVFPSSYFCNYSTKCNFRMYIAFFWYFLHSSVTNLCTLTWDRYNAIVNPFKYSTATTKRHPSIVILTAWLIPLAISLSLLAGMYATESKTVLKILRVTGVSAFDIISCVLLFYAVVRILVVAREKSRHDSAIERQVESSFSSIAIGAVFMRRRKKQNTAPFIIALVVFFLVCYLVANYLVLCITFSCSVPDNAGQIIILLLVLNSAVNPLVYAYLKKDIKSQINVMLLRER